MEKKIIEYKKSMVFVFGKKYNVSEIEANKMIKEYDFDNILFKCNYVVLHDDPEIWVDEIFEWAIDNKELVEL
ncbi:MAG: hypothetical protein IJA34_01600 [Lachnospiraceae bacterium]|nr:hypothetical protein [Lachnospiraceae bacterium]